LVTAPQLNFPHRTIGVDRRNRTAPRQFLILSAALHRTAVAEITTAIALHRGCDGKVPNLNVGSFETHQSKVKQVKK
jgi:hypothetical protein